MSGGFAQTVTGGPLLLAVGIAALAGLVSFLSPCILPLVPGYLSYVTGMVGADLDSGRRKGRVVAGTGLFVAGFAAVFLTTVVLAAQAGAEAGRLLLRHEQTIQMIAGALIIALGLAFLGFIPGLQNEWRIHRLPRAGLVGAPVFGAVFALSWAPCLSPTLGAVVTLSAVGGDSGRAVILGVAYCLGIGLPFVALGLGMRQLGAVVGFIRRNSRWVTRVGGVLLILVGLALVSGVWGDLMNWLRATVGSGEISI